MRGRSSIVVRIAVLFSALVTIALVCIALWISIIVRHDIESLIISDSSQTAVARASQLGETIEKIRWQLNAMALQPALRNSDRRAVAKYIRNFDGKLSPEAAVFFFAWPDGYEVTSSGASASLADRPYFQTIMAGKADWVLGAPAIGKTITTPIIPVAMAVKDESGATVGIVGISLKLEGLSRIVTSFKLGEGGYGWIVDNGGTMLANPRSEFVLKLNISNADKEEGFRGLSALAPRIQGSPSGNGTYTNAQGEAMLTCFTTIPNTPDWKLAINIPMTKFQATAASIVRIFIIGIAAAIGLFLVFSVFIGKSIARPIVRMVTSFKDLAEGDADLTKALAAGRKDELGELASDFNRFIAKLREIVLTLKAAQDELEAAGAKLRTNVSDTTSASSQITASIRSVGEKTRLQSAQVAESSSAVEEIAKNIESLDGVISEQAASVTEASASIEEMVGNIGAVTESTAKMAEAFASLGVSAKEGLAAQELTFQRVDEISTRSESLLEANEAIAKIASQTNLLAMNAAIEAAHAGDAGKGFSVVADEIRNLAETAAEQSHSIGDELKQIRAKIEEVVVASRETGESFSKVMERIDDTDAIVQEVKNAMVEQMEGSTQVLEALKAMNDITSSVRTGSKEMSVGNETILGSIVALRDTSVEIQKNMEEIELGAVAITESAHRVSDIAEGSMTIIGKMDEAIGRFVV